MIRRRIGTEPDLEVVGPHHLRTPQHRLRQSPYRRMDSVGVRMGCIVRGLNLEIVVVSTITAVQLLITVERIARGSMGVVINEDRY